MSKNNPLNKYPEIIGMLLAYGVFFIFNDTIMTYMPLVGRVLFNSSGLGLTYGLSAVVLTGYFAGRLYRKIYG